MAIINLQFVNEICINDNLEIKKINFKQLKVKSTKKIIIKFNCNLIRILADLFANFRLLKLNSANF